MRIEVVITGWEQACCGTSFRVGEQTTWQILAADPEVLPIGAAARFVEEHHDQTPPDVPHWGVTGVVAAITGLSFPRTPVPGLSRRHSWDTSKPDSQALSAVGESEGGAFDQYLVILDVPDDASLPGYRLSVEAIAQREREARAAAHNLARMRDECGVRLEALADDAQRRYAEVAQITRATDRSALTIEPYRDGAAAVRWMRSSAEDGDGDGDGDGITVQVGDGTWNFPASGTDAVVVGTCLDAAAAGRVWEHVVGDPPQRLETEVLAVDGRSWTASRTFQPFESGTGVVAVPRLLWERVQRGEHRYIPWHPRTPVVEAVETR